MKKLFILPLLSIFLSLQVPVSSIHAEEKSILDSTDVYDDLKSIENFNFSKYVLNTSISNDKSISAITLHEDYGKGLYLYLFNRNGKELEKNLVDSRISMSLTENDYSDTSYYSINLLDKTDNNLFYKFKVDYDFPDYSNKRTYHVSEIEFNYGSGFGLGRHATIGRSYFYSGIGEELVKYTKELNVVELDINPGYYRFNTLNENSTIDEQHFWDMFYITFPLNDSYGDLTGIKLAWKEKNYNYTLIDGAGSESYTLSEEIVLEYKNTDLLNLDSLNETSNLLKKVLVNLNPISWFYDQGKDYELPVIEKIEFDNGMFSKFENYYFNEDTIDYLNARYYAQLGSESYYVLRFAQTDFTNSKYVKQVCSGIGNSICIHRYLNHIKYTEILDCDVLTLTFLKDGESYVVMNSSIPEEPINPGTDNPPGKFEKDPNWWKTLFKILCLVLIVVPICFLIAPFIRPIVNLLIKIIALPFKAIGSLFKKKK